MNMRFRLILLLIALNVCLTVQQQQQQPKPCLKQPVVCFLWRRLRKRISSFFCPTCLEAKNQATTNATTNATSHATSQETPTTTDQTRDEIKISKAKSLDSADNPKPPSYILGKIQELLSQGNIRTPKLPSEKVNDADNKGKSVPTIKHRNNTRKADDGDRILKSMFKTSFHPRRFKLHRRIYDEKPDKLSPPNNLKPNGSAGNNSTLDSKPDKQDLVFNIKKPSEAPAANQTSDTTNISETNNNNNSSNHNSSAGMTEKVMKLVDEELALKYLEDALKFDFFYDITDDDNVEDMFNY